jgi:hypothetical protein
MSESPYQRSYDDGYDEGAERLADAERVLRLCAGYLADKNAGRVGKFNATAQALEDYFGEPSLRSIADTSSALHNEPCDKQT